MLPQNRLNDFPLYADAASVNDADLAEAALDGLIEVFLYNNTYFARLKGVQVNGVFYRNLVHSIQYNRRL